MLCRARAPCPRCHRHLRSARQLDTLHNQYDRALARATATPGRTVDARMARRPSLRFYAGWQLANGIPHRWGSELSLPEQLALPVGSPTWPSWASVSHVAGARVVLALPRVWRAGPGRDAIPRSLKLRTLAGKTISTIRAAPMSLSKRSRRHGSIVARCLATWTPESLGQTAPPHVGRQGPDPHTRQSVLWRLITHDAFHSGEVSLVLEQPRLRRDRDVVGAFSARRLSQPRSAGVAERARRFAGCRPGHTRSAPIIGQLFGALVIVFGIADTFAVERAAPSR